jgi:hypothetical protein
LTMKDSVCSSIDQGGGKRRGIEIQRQQAGQRALIQPGRAGEKRRANVDDSAMAFVGGVGGANAPIKNAARMPSSKPKIILRAFGRMTRLRPQNTPATA